MFAEELRQAKERAAIQTEERNKRHEARNRSKSTSQLELTEYSFINHMEDQQYSKIIDSIPVFSGQPKDNVNDWLDIVSLKFDIIGYDSRQKRRFIAQYLTGNTLKWHLAHRDSLLSWDEYTTAIIDAFPQLVSSSRDMNLQLLKDRKQGETESFTEYYESIIDLCRKHDTDMTDLQTIDWLKAGMKITLYEKLQGEDFTTPQALLHRAQRIELDTAVLDARKRTSAIPAQTSSPSKNHSYTPAYYQHRSPNPPPLMSTPYSTSAYNNTTQSPSSTHSYNSTTYARRPIVCYSCGQPGHISPQCPFHPKE